MRTHPTAHRCAVRSALRRQADDWLQAFRNKPGSWRTCLVLLGSSHGSLRPDELYFLAHSLKLAAQKFVVSAGA